MTALWCSSDIAIATGGNASHAFTATGVAFDSREIGPGDLFVAMPGEVTDGHRFVDGAFAAGSAGAIVSRPVAGPHVLVPDTAAALTALAIAARARTAAKVIGVTGSVGKTGTKEALAAALARKPDTRVHRSVKSYNNHTGVPLSLARLPAAMQYAVLEMGMNHAGELAALTRLVRPHVAVVTAIAPAHIEHFASVDAIADAKAEIFQGLEPGGVAVIPFDSPQYDRLRGAALDGGARVLSFGSGAGADVRARDAVPTARGTMVTAVLPEAELVFTVGQAGAHWVSNALAVLAAVHAVGADLALAGLALAELCDLSGRGARLSAVAGSGTALVIDESYNANPASMAATLEVLGGMPARRRIAVLGAMRELGAQSDALHAGLADPLLAADVELAILVGDGIGPLADALGHRFDVRQVPDAGAAAALLDDVLADGDVVLVKGSNSIGLSALVAGLTLAPGA